MSRKRQVLLAVPAALAAALAAATAPAATAAAPSTPPAAMAPQVTGAVAAVKARGTLVMLSFPHQENPFIRVQTEVDLQHYEGIDYEVMQGFASALGVKLEVHPVKPSFDALVPALLRGEGDVIASSFSITPERRAVVAFSQPYYTVHTVVVVPADSPVHAAADLAGRTASTVRGSSLEERIKGLHPGKVHYVEFTRWNYDALEEKEADFTVLDETSTLRLLRFYPDLKVGFQLPGADDYGYAVKPGSDLLAALDGYLAGLRSNGKLAEIVHRYLGAGDAAHEPPPPGRPGAPRSTGGHS